MCMQCSNNLAYDPGRVYIMQVEEPQGAPENTYRLL